MVVVVMQVALMDKSDDFVAAQHIPTFKKLVDHHLFTDAPVQECVAKKRALEVDEFNLVMKQLKYDQKVFENYQKKCSSVHAAREHSVQEFRLNRRHKAMDMASAFIDGSCKLMTWEKEKPEAAIGEIMNYRREIAAKLGVDGGAVPSIVFLNWASPSAIAVSVQESQLGTLTWALADNMQSVALALSPVFTYSKGKLHVEEAKMLDMLARGNHNLDWQFSVVFKEKSDERDLRPMVYPGRFVFPSPLGDPKKNKWFSCDLRRNHRTEEVKQLSPKYMKELE